MKYGNLTLGQIEAIVNKLGGMDVVMNILRDTVEVITKTVSYITDTFTVLVDETKTVEQLTSDGKYDWSNSDITSKNFPLPEDGQTEERVISLFHFNKTMTSEEVIEEMDREGCRPATIHELLGLGIVQPDIQRNFLIIALGSFYVIDGRRFVASLYRNADERDLYLARFGHDWDDVCRFAGVRNSPQD